MSFGSVIDSPTRMQAYVKPYIEFAKKNNKKLPTFAMVQALLKYGRKFT